MFVITIKEVSERYDLSQDTLRYYERVGMIPPVHRTASGIRDYQPDDLGWIELAKCMRGAGLPVEAIIEYVKLTQEGEHTIPARLQLLTEQRELLLEQKEKIDTTLKRLNYKIERYEIAVETGELKWDCPLADGGATAATCHSNQESIPHGKRNQNHERIID